jgi:hypothetical protein
MGGIISQFLPFIFAMIIRLIAQFFLGATGTTA